MCKHIICISVDFKLLSPSVLFGVIIVFVMLVATGFPAGQTPLHTRLEEITYAVSCGASEIDVVINRQYVLSGNWKGELSVLFRCNWS